MYKRVEKEFFEGLSRYCPRPREECESIEGIPLASCRCGVCCDCREDPGATLEKPEFFEDFE